MQHQQSDELRKAELLANRLRTLLDVMETRRGTEVTYQEVADELEQRNIKLSRARWSYMINGHRYVRDEKLLTALADFFGVGHDYLLGEKEPAMAAAELDLVRAMRAAKVKTFAARTLGDLSPDVLGAITKILDEEAARAGDKHSAEK